jgi:2-methylcitrate dehydratase PrpD
LHPFIEAAGVLADRGVRSENVSRLLCRVPAAEASIICEPWESKQAPETAHAGRWSLPIVVAARLIEGKVDMATFESPASAPVRELARRIRWEPLADARFPVRFEAEIVCEIKAGPSHTVRIDDVYGNHTRPPDAEVVLAKFRTNASRSLQPMGVVSVEGAAEALTVASNLDALSRALRQVKSSRSGAA